MSTEVADVVNTFKMLAELPTDSLGAYVISMARSASDVLAVVLLQRECGVKVRKACYKRAPAWRAAITTLSMLHETPSHTHLHCLCRTTSESRRSLRLWMIWQIQLIPCSSC